MKSINAIVEIELDSVRSENYQDNIKKYGESESTCLICGRTIKDLDKSKMVHLLNNGNIVSLPTNDIEDSQGFYPVGYDCAKKLIINFAF